MGGNSSKSSVEQTNEFFNKTTNSIVSTNKEAISASQVASNSLDFQGATFSGCRTFIRQSIVGDTMASGKMTDTQISDLRAQLTNKAKEQIDNEATQKSGFLAPTVMNSAEARTNLKNKVQNIVETTITTSAVQEIIAQSNNTNVGVYRGLTYTCNPKYKSTGKCGSDGTEGCDLVVDQNIKASVVAKGIADKLTQALSTVIADNTVDSTVKNTSSQTSAGLDDLVKALTGMWGMIAGAVLLCICMIVIVMMMSGKGGGSAPPVPIMLSR